GAVGEHITVPARILAGDNNAGLVGILARGCRGIDRDDDPDELRQRLFMWPARRIEEPTRPQCPGHIIEELGEQFLAAETRALIALDTLEDLQRDIGAVLVGGTAGDNNPASLIGQEFA